MCVQCKFEVSYSNTKFLIDIAFWNTEAGKKGGKKKGGSMQTVSSQFRVRFEKYILSLLMLTSIFLGFDENNSLLCPYNRRTWASWWQTWGAPILTLCAAWFPMSPRLQVWKIYSFIVGVYSLDSFHFVFYTCPYWVNLILQVWWRTSWSSTSSGVTVCWRVSESAGKVSPAESSMVTSSRGTISMFITLLFLKNYKN